MAEKVNAQAVSNDPENQNSSRSGLSGFLRRNWYFIFAILYMISPIDLIPDDPIPLVGMADDTAIFMIEIIRRIIEFRRSQKSS